MPTHPISIHAPAKGATSAARTSAFASYFNPRSREGSDQSSRSFDLFREHFNPRSREGSDRTTRRPHRSSQDFNPRSREGSDPGLCAWSGCSVYFNPRSREGSDLEQPQPRAPQVLFQSTLPRRERRGGKGHFWRYYCHFNPRSREGSDEYLLSKWGNPFYFNPRSREGSDTTPVSLHRLRWYFNPRSREGSDIMIASKTLQLLISIHAPAKGATITSAAICRRS